MSLWVVAVVWLTGGHSARSPDFMFLWVVVVVWFTGGH